MARRRYQRGALRLEGSRWVLRWREDVVNTTTGEIRRAEKRLMIGTIEQLATRALARRAADQLIGHLNPIDYRPGMTVSVPDFAEIYLADALPMMKRTTQISVRALLRRHIVPFFATCAIHEVAGRLPQQFVTHLSTKGLRRKTVRNAVSVLSRMLDLARQYGYQAVKLDLKLIKFPPDEIEGEERCFTPEEAQRIVDAAEGMWRVCFALMAYLGLRCGEALGLAWPHVDFEAGLIRVRQAAVLGKIQTVKSRNSKADLPMPEVLRSLLTAYRINWQPNEQQLLFVTDRGTPFWATNVRLHRFYPLLERLGIAKGGLHAFRHGQATNLFAAGIAAPTVRGMLRHGDLKTTLRYTHVVTEEQRKAVESVSALLLKHQRTGTA